jgi:hypothetical protein
MTPTEQRTSALRSSDRIRKKRQRRRSGKPGRKSQAQKDKAQTVIDKYKDNAFDFFVSEELPLLTPTQVKVVNVLLLPDTHCLTNKQIAGLLGIHPETVNGFRDSREYYRAIAESTAFEKKLEVLEAQSMVALERNIVEDRDNAAIKMVLVMRQRLEEAHRNVFQISADTVQIGIGQSLKNLPDAKYEVIEDKSTQADTEQGDNDTE